MVKGDVTSNRASEAAVASMYVCMYVCMCLYYLVHCFVTFTTLGTAPTQVRK